MALYLVQHGEAMSAEQDPERGLTERGRADVDRIAGVAQNYGVHVSVIRHSGKVRAAQTAVILAGHLSPSGGVVESAGLAPSDDVSAIAGDLDPERDEMLVEHLPFMERLAALLVTGDADSPIFRFQKGGIVCLERFEDIDGWLIKWALMPNID